MAGSFPLLMVLILVMASIICCSDAARNAGARRRWLVMHGRSQAVAHPGDAPESARLDGTPDGLGDTAMMLELVASMLDAGAGIGRSLELIARCSHPTVATSLRPVVAALAMGADWGTAWGSPVPYPPEVARLKEALAFAALTGAPSAAILYAQAARERREQFRAAEKRAAALGVKLVVPLGLCSLPAFICLGIVPVLIAMVPAG
ncbi:type II secretion system F family protein [Paenarthrobacter ilicis]|uniref:Type II secretion system protein GspF domain-containing protein n=1 Tax=Paenarthrobacter ilicis TaxID=43665 RepID=A0ABX0THS4_9MICC|nr:type II secretion system F family protein [Paenarthrobacter ilicis]MBM7794301.1 hypothetical protein [Paenarthrobacter ilicis]NIJ00481.1 hypothetical protein [Paenarthrobacter ilicis]